MLNGFLLAYHTYHEDIASPIGTHPRLKVKEPPHARSEHQHAARLKCGLDIRRAQGPLCRRMRVSSTRTVGRLVDVVNEWLRVLGGLNATPRLVEELHLLELIGRQNQVVKRFHGQHRLNAGDAVLAVGVE
eukprot:scaffold133288_cov78-Phaeocystis_antarctica.AAC.2